MDTQPAAAPNSDGYLCADTAYDRPGKTKTGHNLKFDCLVLMRHGLMVSPLSYDTMLAEWVSDPDSHNLGLKEMAETYLDISMTHIEELIGKGKNQKTMDLVPIEQVAPYAAADAEVSLRLVPVMQKRLESSGRSEEVLCNLEVPLVPVLAQMEMNGIRLDREFLKKMSDEIQVRLGELDGKIQDLAGHPLNINSTQQLSKVLFEELKACRPTLAGVPPAVSTPPRRIFWRNCAEATRSLKPSSNTASWPSCNPPIY